MTTKKTYYFGAWLVVDAESDEEAGRLINAGEYEIEPWDGGYVGCDSDEVDEIAEAARRRTWGEHPDAVALRLASARAKEEK